ncbi:MAG: cadherin-like domain-containing protein, partial [Pseudomonadota bacterium]
ATAPGYIGIGSPQRPPILDIATSTSGDIIFNATGPIEIFDNVVAETGDLSATSRAGHIFVESTATISGGSASFSAPNDLFFQDNLFGTDLITIIASDPNGSGVNIEAGGVQIRGSIRSAAGIDITATSQGSGTGIGAVDFLNRDDTTTPLARTLVSSACNGGTACDPITTENGSIQAATDIVLTAERWFYEKPISSGTSFTVNMVDVVDGDMIFFRGAVPSAPVLNFNTDGPLIVEGFDINDPVVQEVNFQIEGRVTLDGDLSVGSGANLSELDFQYSGGADLDGSIDLGNASLTFQDNGSGRFRLPGEESIMAGTTTVSSTEYQIDGSISGDQVRLTFSGDGQLGGPDAPADGGLDNSELERITPNALTVDSLGSLTILDFQPDYNTGIPTDVTFTASGDIEVLGNVIGTYSPQQDVLNISFGEDGGRRPTGVDVFGLLGFTDTGIEDQATSFQFYVDGDVNINPSAGTFAPGDTIVSAGTLVVDVTGDFLQVNSSDPDGTPELSHGFGGTGLNVDSVELRNANRLELYGTIGGQDAADARDGVAVAPGFTVNDLHQVNDCSLAIANCNIEPVAVDDFVATDSPAPITLNVLNNDSDGDAGDVLTVISISEPSNGGVFEFNADGEVVFQPAEIFNALPLNQTVTTSIDYTVDDGFGGTAEATLTVQVFRPVPEEVIDVVNTIPQLPRDTATTFEREGPLSPNEERIFGIFEEFAYSRPLLEVDEPIVNRGNDEEWGR